MKTLEKTDLEKVQEQLEQTMNDPDMAILECHCFNIEDFYKSENRRRIETKGERCKRCSHYIEFARAHPKRIPYYELNIYPLVKALVK